MSYQQEVLSPAKLNLVLRIGPKRRDSYHELAGLFVKLNWGDEMKMAVRQASSTNIRIECNHPELANEANLAVRAAKAFSEAIPVFFDLDIRLTKRVPMQAGLGGGSSNAASVLKFLSQWYLSKIGRYPKMDLLVQRLGTRLGADIGFFLSGHAAAWCTGIGERVKALKVKKMPVLLVFPEIGLSTAWAYQKLDEERRSKKMNFDREPPSWLSSLAYDVPSLENDFEALALREHSDLRRLKLDLAQSGALCGQMTGSGSCFFGIYSDAESLQKAEDFIRSRSWRCQQVSMGE